MAARGNLSGFHAYAQELIPSKLTSNLLDVPVLFAALSRKGTTSGEFGRPGASVVIGRQMAVGEVRNVNGSTQRQIRFQTEVVGGGKWLSTDGTTSSTGVDRQDNKVQSCYVSWAFHEQPIEIANMTLRMTGGGNSEFAIASAISEATTMAINEQFDTLGTAVWTGSPTTTTADVYDTIVGLGDWLDDDNTIGGVNRSSVTGFDAIRNDTATVATLSLLDNIKVGATTNLADRGGRGDVAITTNEVYAKLKQEALARGAVLTTSSMPEAGQVGFMSEYFNYNGTLVTFDPKAPTASDGHWMAVLDSGTWELEVHPGDNFRVLPFRNLADEGAPGSADRTVSKIRAGLRLSCIEPRKNALYTNLSV